MRIVTMLGSIAMAAACGATPPDDGAGAPDGGSDTSGLDYERLFPADRVVDVDLAISQADWDALLVDPRQDVWVPATLTYDGVTVPQIAMRLKGNSSRFSVDQRGSERFSFKLDIDELVPGQKLFGVDKLNLNNVFKDPSYLRERLASEVYQAAGVPAARVTHARVTRNGELFGLYVVVEQVDKDFLRDRFADASGNLYKPEIPTGDLVWRGATIDAYPGMELKTNEDAPDHTALLAMLDVLNHAADAELETALGAVLDVDAVLRYLAATTALVNLDSYAGTGHNYYLYADPSTGKFAPIAWDANEAFGNFGCMLAPSALLALPYDQPICGPAGQRPLIMRVLAVPAWRAAYEQHLRDLLAGAFATAAITTRVDTLAALVRADVQQDPTRFFGVAEFELNLHDDLVRGPSTTFGLTSFVTRRSAALDAALP